jgi:hypothetical protein
VPIRVMLFNDTSAWPGSVPVGQKPGQKVLQWKCSIRSFKRKRGADGCRVSFFKGTRGLVAALCTASNSRTLAPFSASAGHGASMLLTLPAAVFPDVRAARISFDEDDDPAGVLSGEGDVNA